MITIPENIKKIVDINKYKVDTIGMSDSSVLIFDDKVLKIEKEKEESNYEAEVMKWLKGKLPVPEILYCEKQNGNNYLLMSKLSGLMSCDEFYMKKPEELTSILAEGLKMLWQVDLSDCVYNWRLNKKLEMAEYNIKHNLVDMNNVESDTFGENGFKDPKQLLNWLIEHKPEEDLVFSHGDFCLPNIFIENGKISGYIDLGKTGIADRYQDIALCYRSLKHNYNEQYNDRKYKGFKPDILFDKLGLDPDWDKINYYILLDELF